jgi:hypothetical protein
MATNGGNGYAYTGAWYYWNDISASANTVTSNCNTTWQGWTIEPATAYNTTTGTNIGNEWTQWIQQPDGTGIEVTVKLTWDAWVGTTYPSTIEETDEQREARLQREEEARQERERREAERKEQLRKQEEERALAQAKATELLREVLTEKQLAEYEKSKQFTVIAASKKRYVIRESGAPLEVDKEGKTLASYCIHPSTWFPKQDIMLGHKLMLEDDEENWLRIANRTPVRV